MASSSTELDEQIERLRKGDTLAENEVKALCDKVSGKWRIRSCHLCWIIKRLQVPVEWYQRQWNGRQRVHCDPLANHGGCKIPHR